MSDPGSFSAQTTPPSHLLGLSFDAQASVAIHLRAGDGTDEQGGAAGPVTGLAGWGVGWYPGDERAATVLADPEAPRGGAFARLFEEWGHVRSSVFIAQTRGAEHRDGLGDAEPFLRSYAGRNFLFAKAGELSRDVRVEFPLGDDFDLAPIGHQPAEHVFSWLISRMRQAGAASIGDFGWEGLCEAFTSINAWGGASFLLSDGQDLVAYRDATDHVPMFWARRTPPHESSVLEGRSVTVDCGGPMDEARTLFAFSTTPLKGARWTPLEPGEMRVVRRGTAVWSSHPSGVHEKIFSAAPNLDPAASQSQQQGNAVAVPVAATDPPRPASTGPATLSVSHTTSYHYSMPVERSSHRFCLQPVEDERQEVLEHALEISVDGVRRDFEDVFGNRATVLDVVAPFEEMRITSRSKVLVEGVSIRDLKSPLRRDQIPLTWMPWQRQMMQAYLLPAELPETQLRELSDFAMSFVERNDYHLVETLLDLNRTIYRDFTYVPSSTTVETTPFQVYEQRRGVCQDFANVLICLARLMGVPARYRVGYIYTGGNYENRIQSDASHAWAELYLPWTGWCGLDPTNGCLAGPDHVRVACGRLFRDAAPTSGTIYRGGGLETLSVEVKVDRLDP